MKKKKNMRLDLSKLNIPAILLNAHKTVGK